MNINDETTALIDAHLLYIKAAKQNRKNACQVYNRMIKCSIDKLSLHNKEDLEMIVYMDSRNAARKYARKYNKLVVDKGQNSPKGRRWAVRLY